MQYNDYEFNNNCWFSNESLLNFDNLELIYLYIDNYHQFKNFRLNLNAKYKVRYIKGKNELIIKDNNDCIKIYPNNININFLCGKNGVGKSTIINILKNIDAYKNCFIVYKSGDEDFITNKKDLHIIFKDKSVYCSKGDVGRNGRYFHLSNGEELIDINRDSNYVGEFCHGYLYHYKDLNQVLSKEYKNYFDHFCLGFDDIDKNSDYVKVSVESKYNIPIHTIGGLGSYFRENPIKFIMLFDSFDSSFDNKHQYYANTNFQADLKSDIPKLFDEILKNIYGSKNFKRIERINNQFINFVYDTSEYKKEIQKYNSKINTNKIFSIFEKNRIEHLRYSNRKSHKSSYYPSFKNTMQHFEYKLNVIYEEVKGSNLKINFHNFFYLDLYKKIPNGNIYFWRLSEGEKRQYITILNLYYKLVLANSLAQTLIFEDDIDAYLHPEWSRRYIDMYIKALKAFQGNDEKYRNIIIATHSPFVLSDTTNDYIEYLEKKNNKTKVRNKKNITNTFASNIMQMFEDNMFMDASIGEYSLTILKEIIKYLDKQYIDNPIILKKSLSPKTKIDICKKIINSIGDNVLKKILKRKLEQDITNGKTKYFGN